MRLGSTNTVALIVPAMTLLVIHAISRSLHESAERMPGRKGEQLPTRAVGRPVRDSRTPAGLMLPASEHTRGLSSDTMWLERIDGARCVAPLILHLRSSDS
jgi:hypothetical protein